MTASTATAVDKAAKAKARLEKEQKRKEKEKEEKDKKLSGKTSLVSASQAAVSWINLFINYYYKINVKI